MKNYSKFIFYLILIILVSACGSTKRMTMGITNPAIIHLSKEIKNVGIINRSEPSQKNNTLDKIDQILSAEGFNLDKKGAEAAISSIAYELEMIQDFESIKRIENVEDIKKGIAILPASLSWDIVDQLCEENNVDLIFSLEFYDTDTKSSFKVTTIPVKNNLGVKVSVPGQEVTLNTSINSGWRIYNPQTRLVIDERIYTKNMVFSGSGINPLKAVEAVQRRNETIEEYSKNVGIAYAQRLVPNSTRISRDYFVSGTDNFKLAQRRALTGDWEGAANLWKKELNNPDFKIRGRANYNMAISSEIDGDLDLAVQYASAAYTDYKNKLALDYVNILKYRQQQNDILKQQLSL